jgi:hypothetical protein
MVPLQAAGYQTFLVHNENIQTQVDAVTTIDPLQAQSPEAANPPRFIKRGPHASPARGLWQLAAKGDLRHPVNAIIPYHTISERRKEYFNGQKFSSFQQDIRLSARRYRRRRHGRAR